MLDCASRVPPDSSFGNYLKEYDWKVERGGKLFTQINQSEVLSEFMSVVLSPLSDTSSRKAQRADSIRVFVSYSHADSAYLKPNGLLGYLSGLEREGFEFWHDRRLVAGDAWDSEIKKAVADSDIALVLVS